MRFSVIGLRRKSFSTAQTKPYGVWRLDPGYRANYRGLDNVTISTASAFVTALQIFLLQNRNTGDHSRSGYRYPTRLKKPANRASTHF